MSKYKQKTVSLGVNFIKSIGEINNIDFVPDDKEIVKITLGELLMQYLPKEVFIHE